LSIAKSFLNKVELTWRVAKQPQSNHQIEQKTTIPAKTGIQQDTNSPDSHFPRERQEKSIAELPPSVNNAFLAFDVRSPGSRNDWNDRA
jgi:hypothetical protein